MAAVILMVVALVGGLVVTAGPAAAAQACRASSREFVHPGPYPNTFVTITLCVISTPDDSRVQGRAHIKWTRAASGSVLDEFEKFVVTVRIRYSGTSRNSNVCNIAVLINQYRNSETWCWTSQLAKTGGPSWDTAGSVLYNINNDGRGDMNWTLSPTPRI